MSQSPFAPRRPSRVLLAVLLAFGVTGCAHADERDVTPGVSSSVVLPPQAKGKPPAWSGRAFRQGVVAVANPYGAEAGAAILEQGGNAIDAAVAIAYALNVVEPQSAGIGGGGFMMIHVAKTGQTITIDSREKAPAGATRDMFVGVPNFDGIAVGRGGRRARAWCVAPRWRSKSTAGCRWRRCCSRRSSWRTTASPPRRASSAARTARARTPTSRAKNSPVVGRVLLSGRAGDSGRDGGHQQAAGRHLPPDRDGTAPDCFYKVDARQGLRHRARHRRGPDLEPAAGRRAAGAAA